jgi:hypothetical protein
MATSREQVAAMIHTLPNNAFFILFPFHYVTSGNTARRQASPNAHAQTQGPAHLGPSIKSYRFSRRIPLSSSSKFSSVSLRFL